ncbi:MAG: hypothetical protein KYX69_19810 [Sphingomonas sp.]|uniref:hypothetical protein n=1 Tax=Sphingomonas sp. TaxID=28214 RepID=UPI0026163A7D|nr:hypothetical protein [Sphingomonas sp.]MDK2769951.1 hypothetical protein [Sphingomonas sp.]
MTPFASVALFRRNGSVVFKAPRKESSAEKTQARKSASRFWSGSIVEPDKLTKLVVLAVGGGLVLIGERQPGRAWMEYRMTPAEAAKQPHLAACLSELGVDADQAPPPLPDTLEINGAIYRREI